MRFYECRRKRDCLTRTVGAFLFLISVHLGPCLLAVINGDGKEVAVGWGAGAIGVTLDEDKGVRDLSIKVFEHGDLHVRDVAHYA
jgi:hypothetical protein